MDAMIRHTVKRSSVMDGSALSIVVATSRIIVVETSRNGVLGRWIGRRCGRATSLKRAGTQERRLDMFGLRGKGEN